MTNSKPFIIANEEIALGETKDLKIHFSESYLGLKRTLPIRVIRAKTPGPTVFLTGAIHGDELAGIGIIRELLYGNPPKLICGTLICIPVVNIFGLENHTRYLPDRRDLNRSFPGTPDGSMTSRMAHVLFNEVILKCDLGIDFHSAAIRRTNYPNVRADMKDPKVKELAHAFGCELIINGKGPQNSLRRTAVKHGIPTIILEAGEVWKNEPAVVEVGLKGCLNVLKHLNMIEGEPDFPLFQVVVDKTTWLRAERGGFLGFNAKPGDLVNKGDEMATNYNIFGIERNSLKAPCQGIVLGMATMPAVKPGEPVYNIAKLGPNTFKRTLKKIQKSVDDEPFTRIQDDLATSITIQGQIKEGLQE